MSNEYSEDNCDCCKYPILQAPLKIYNRPGLSHLNFRSGTHAIFKASMISRIPKFAALSSLTTRSDKDLSIGIIDSMALVSDVLTFYEEVFANEGFLNTSREDRSILELAKSVGYRPGTGVAASTLLAFTLEENPSDPQKEIIIEKGTKVQSIPEQGQMPQIFETEEEINARPAWNALLPKINDLQIVTNDLTILYLKGINNRLQPADMLLIIRKDDPGVHLHNVNENLKTILNVQIDSTKQQTFVELSAKEGLNTKIDDKMWHYDSNEPKIVMDTKERSMFMQTVIKSTLKELVPHVRTQNYAAIYNPERELVPSDLISLAINNNISIDAVFDNYFRKAKQFLRESNDLYNVFTFRISAFLFGHELLNSSSDADAGPAELQHTVYDFSKSTKRIYLDTVYEGVLPGSWIVLSKGASDGEAPLEIHLKVLDVNRETVSFPFDSLTSTVTSIGIDTGSDALDELLWGNNSVLENFYLHSTVVLARSDNLEVAEERPHDNTGIIRKDGVILGEYVHGLVSGQALAISGKIVNTDKVGSEVAIISSVGFAEDGYSPEIFFQEEIENIFEVETVKINANVARANHGETKLEVLGSGDNAKKQQQFFIQQEPLTYVSARVQSGAQSTLEVRVNNLRWKEVDSFLDTKATNYVYRVNKDLDGKTSVIFGDGAKGSRLPTGTENVIGKLRTGLGASGLLKPKQLSLLLTRPLGVDSVTNPVPCEAAAEPEDLYQIRRNIPRSLETMGRVINTLDFENFALQFEGIGKALCTLIWTGEILVVHITIGSAFGEPISRHSDLYRNLRQSIITYREPTLNFELGNFTVRTFNLVVNIKLDSDRDPKEMKKVVEQTLAEKFAYRLREFGQPLYKNEIITAIQRIEGIEMVDLDYLYFRGEEKKLNDYLLARKASWDPYANIIVEPELILINPAFGTEAVVINILGS
jgi:hypothetical protein